MLVARPATRPATLARAAYAKLMASIGLGSVESITKTMRDGESVLRIITKAEAPIGTTTGAGFAAELAHTSYGDYLGWLAPASAAARIIAMGLTVPMAGPSFLAPARNTAPVGFGFVGESMPIPVWSANLLGTTLTAKKLAAIAVITREAAKRGGEAAVTTMLQEDGVRALDGGYFSTAAGDANTHSGLLAGLSSLAPYAGGDKLAFEQDILALLGVVAPNGSGNIVFVTGQLTAQRIALKFPDFKSPVFASQAVADTRIIAVDAGALVHAFGDYEIELGGNATVHMDTSPAANIGDATTDVLSIWQTDAMALRIIGDIAFAGRKANVAAFIDNMTW